MVQASVFSTTDVSRLTALVQSSQEAAGEDGDLEPGVPEAAVYKGHSEGIVETLEDLLDSAETQLDGAVKKETTSTYNFDLLKQSLEHEIKVATTAMSDAKKGINESGQ